MASTQHRKQEGGATRQPAGQHGKSDDRRAERRYADDEDRERKADEKRDEKDDHKARADKDERDRASDRKAGEKRDEKDERDEDRKARSHSGERDEARKDEDRKADERDEDRSRGSARDEDDEGGAPNPIQVQKFLGGLDYPVDKAEIVQKARDEGADERVLDALERIPEGEYESPVAVSKEVGKLD